MRGARGDDFPREDALKVKVTTPWGHQSHHVAKWDHWDGHNLTVHHVTGPLFTERDSQQEREAYIEFLKLKNKQMLKYPPCDRAKVLEELRKKHYRKA
jgi:hypothetical protein